MRDSPQIRWISHDARNLRGYWRNTFDYMVITRFLHVDYLILEADSIVAFKSANAFKLESDNTFVETL